MLMNFFFHVFADFRKMKYLAVCLILSCISEILGTMSGLYFDNGKDQTILERTISRRERIKFEREMLEVLGLPRKPRRNKTAPLTSSAPKFLLNIYNSFMEGTKLRNEFNLKSEDIRSVKESDAIMTFLTTKNHVNGVRHEKGKRLFFDIKDVSMADAVSSAELRLYKLRSNESEKYTVTVYRVLLDMNGEKELEYMDAVNVTNSYEGWLVFNLTSAFVSWAVFPSINKGLYISVHRHYRPGHEVHPESAGIISSVFDDVEDQQPFMVAFLKYGPNGMKLKHRRTRRDVSVRRKKSEDDVSYNTNPLYNSESVWTLRNCQIQTLYVNFKDLQWQDWIIAPDGYAAYYCSGLCDFPLNAHMNATNHAIVQTLVHLINPQAAPKACCAPTKLGSIAVLYYLEDSNVILKRYPDMIVKSCGCH